MSIAAVVVIYMPGEELLKLLKSMEGQFDRIIICNNGFGSKLGKVELADQFKNLEILEMYGNKGIGYALNRAIERLTELKFEFMVTFDQDSEIGADFVESLLRSYRNEINSATNLGIMAPVYKDRNSGEYAGRFTFTKYGFYRDYRIMGERNQVTMAITSGSLSALSLYDEVGRYIEDMFIDYVDNEFCLRLYQLGFKIVIDDSIVMEHSLGDRDTFRVGPLKFSPTNHSAIRKYYISRNRLYCVRRYGLMLPGFALFELFAFTNDLLRVFLFETPKKEKLNQIFRGLRDGLTFTPQIQYLAKDYHGRNRSNR